MSNCKVLLMGVSFDNWNRGVCALGIGAVNIIKESIDGAEIRVLNSSNINKKIQTTIYLKYGKEVKVETFYVTKISQFETFLELLALKTFGNKPKQELSKLIQEADVVFHANEGDSFSDIYGIKRIVRMFIESFLVIFAKKKLIFLPQTIGPFNTIYGKFMGSYILRRVSRLYVRDDKSNDFLNRINVRFTKWIDMAVYMQPKPCGFSVKSGTIGINISSLIFYGYSKNGIIDPGAYKEFITMVIDELIKNNFRVLLIPHTYQVAAGQNEGDLSAIKEMMKLKNHDSLDFINSEYNAQELKYIISKLDFFIGSRMHSCIAALSSNIPTVGLAYSYKYEGTFDMFEQKECIVDLKRLQSKSLINLKKVNMLIENRAAIKEALTKINLNRKDLMVNI